MFLLGIEFPSFRFTSYSYHKGIVVDNVRFQMAVQIPRDGIPKWLHHGILLLNRRSTPDGDNGDVSQT
jgi:hypothetical protein